MSNVQYIVPQISVIIPMYNIGSYIVQCIESILNQSYKNFELILINDGSTDNTFELCKIYAQKDERVLLFSQQNLGVSVARNEGLRIARGEYIVFVDGDDTLEHNALATLFDAIDGGTYDLSCAQSQLIDSNDKVTNPSSFQPIVLNAPGEIAQVCYTNSVYWDMLTGPCAKLYKRYIIMNNNIRFPEGMKHYEDIVFNFAYYKKIKTLKLIDNIVYNYRINPLSASHICGYSSFIDLITVFNKRNDFYRLLNDIDERMLANQFVAVFIMLLRMSYRYHTSITTSLKMTKDLLLLNEILWFIDNAQTALCQRKVDCATLLCLKTKSAYVIFIFFSIINYLSNKRYIRNVFNKIKILY